MVHPQEVSQKSQEPRRRLGTPETIYTDRRYSVSPVQPSQSLLVVFHFLFQAETPDKWRIHTLSRLQALRYSSCHITQKNVNRERFTTLHKSPSGRYRKAYQSSIGPKWLSMRPRPDIIMAFWNKSSYSSLLIISLFWFWSTSQAPINANAGPCTNRLHHVSAALRVKNSAVRFS